MRPRPKKGSSPHTLSTGIRPGPTMIVAAVLALSACAGSEAGMEWAGTVTDSAGVQIVHNPAQGTWSPGDAWSFQEELRIGALDGAPELQFGQVISLDVTDGGEIYILDQQAQEVRVFDAAGEYVRTVGSPGQGPAELSPQVQAVFADAGGAVRVVDLGNQRVTAFGSDGSHAGEFRIDMSAGIPIRWEVDTSGRLVAQLRGMAVQGMEAHEGGDPVVVYGDSGSVADTLHVLPRGQSMEIRQDQLPRIRLFEPEPIWDLGPGALYTAMNNEYRIELRGLDGTVARILTRSVQRRPVQDSDRALFRRVLRKTMEDQGTPPQFVEAMLGNVSFADHYPAFAQVMAGPFGTIMVQDIITADDVSGGDETAEINPQDLGAPDWAVFDSEGRYLGMATFPQRFQPMKVVGDHVYGVWRDELDVQWVLKLKTVMPAT